MAFLVGREDLGYERVFMIIFFRTDQSVGPDTCE
jgi:hypothetical protein